MKNNQPKIIGLLNGYSSQMSGGDKHFIKLLNYITQQHDVSVCLPNGVYAKDLNKQINRLEYYNPDWVHSLYKNNFWLFFLYIFRIIRSTWTMLWSDHQVAITSSHLFFDIVPLLFLPKKIKSPFCTSFNF